MSDFYQLYVVDEARLPTSLKSSDDMARYRELVAAVKAVGAEWARLELGRSSFINGLEAVNDLLGISKKIIPIFSFNNSPHNLLGDDPEIGDACFGYFNPEQANDVADVLEDVKSALEDRKGRYQEAVQRSNEVSRDLIELVFDQYLMALREAKRRGYALAVLHNEG